jgi:hypothetical protein
MRGSRDTIRSLTIKLSTRIAVDQTIAPKRQVFFAKRGEKPASRRDAIRFDVIPWASRDAASAWRRCGTLRKGNLHGEFPL